MKATKHNLTPLVYSTCHIKPPSKTNLKTTYFGSSYIALRSGKHNSSTTYTHGGVFDHLFELKDFDKVVKHENFIKPIGMFFCDGGADENPIFPKTLDVVIHRL